MSRALAKLAVRALACQPQSLFQLHTSQSLRFFSTGGNTVSDDDPEFLCSYKATQKLRDLQTNTQDFMRCYGASTSPDLDNMIEKAENAAADKFKLDKLKQLFSTLIRPELVSRLLIHGYPLEDKCTQWLKYQTHAHMKKMPRFTTSFDVTATLMQLPKSAWVFLLNYLSEERICVLDDNWDSISDVKHMLYEHGPQDFSGIHFHKGEADASWQEATKTADISILIWDGEQVVDAQTFLGVTKCESSVQSEAKAALTILMRAAELKIPNFVLWTDNSKVADIFTGRARVCYDYPGGELFVALKSMRASFERLVVTHVPRKLVAFADSMLREADVQYAKTNRTMLPRYATQSADKWAYELNGLPIFDLSMRKPTRDVIKTFGKPNLGEPSSNKYYIEVADNMKMSALCNVLKILKPLTAYLAVHNIEMKQEDILKDIYDLMGSSISVKSGEWSIFVRRSSLNSQGSLLVTFDGLLLENGPDVEFTISLCSQGTKGILIANGYLELSASAYFHYHGPCTPI